MTVSSRTHEGHPSECPLCGTNTNLEFSNPADDAPCPVCGCLIWKSTEILDTIVQKCEHTLGIDPTSVTVNSRYVDDLGSDSMDLVELVMELEEEFNIVIPDGAAEELHTIGDTVRLIQAGRCES